MRRDDFRIRIVCRMLHRTEIVNIDFLRHDNDAARMLTGVSADACTALDQAVFLRASNFHLALCHVFFDVAVCGFFRNRADSSRAEYMVMPEQLAGVPVNGRLILTGEVQVNIRYFIAVEAQERLKRNGKSLLIERFSALRTGLVRHICAAAKALIFVPFDVMAFRAQIMRRERIYLGDVRHKRNQRRTNRTTGTDQIAVLQRLRHKLLRNHVHYIVAVADNRAQFALQARLDLFRQRVAVHALGFLIAHAFQILRRIIHLRRIVFARYRTQRIAPVRNHIRIGDNYFHRAVCAQIRKFLQHFIGGFEVQRGLIVGVFKAHARHQDAAERLVLRLQEMHVTGCHTRLAQFIRNRQNLAVVIAQFFLVLCGAVGNHKLVVANRLNFQIIIEIRNFEQLFV